MVRVRLRLRHWTAIRATRGDGEDELITRRTRTTCWTSLVAGAAMSLITSYRLATRSLVLGSETGHWVYRYLYRFNFHVLAVFFVVCGVCFVASAIPFRVIRRYEWPMVALWLVIGLFSQRELRTLTPFSFDRIIRSEGATGFYTAALRYPVTTLVTDFDRIRPTLAVHPRSNMPGKLVLVSAFTRLSKRPEVVGWLVVIASNIGGLVLYLLVRDLSGDAVTALLSLVFYLLVPAKLFFFPVLNTVTPVVMLIGLYLWLRVLRHRGVAHSIGLGVALYGLAFFEPLPLVLGVLFAALAVRALLLHELTWRRLSAQVSVTTISFLATYVAMRWWFHFDLISTFRQLLTEAVAFNAVAHRPYRIWIGQNLLDFAFGAGVCQTVMWLGVVADGLSRADRRQTGTTLREPFVVFSLCLALVVLVTDLLGVNRGEVLRLWIFLVCLLSVPAAYVCARLESRTAVMLIVATTLLQDAVGTAMVNFARP